MSLKNGFFLQSNTHVGYIFYVDDDLPVDDNQIQNQQTMVALPAGDS